MKRLLDLTKHYSFADYITWFDYKRRELWNGFIKMMTPATNTYHQVSSGNIYGDIYKHINKKKKKKRYLLFSAPFDVRFPNNNEKERVKEYWLVFPHKKVIQSFILENKNYIKNKTFAKENKIPVTIFNNKLEIEINDIFVELNF